MSQAYGRELESSRSQETHLRIPKNPTTNKNLLKEFIHRIEGIKNPLIETMQIRENPLIKGRDRTTRTMTTYHISITKKSIPPRLSKNLIPDTFKHICNRLKAPKKENYRSKRTVNKVLGTMHINLITMTAKSSSSQTPFYERVTDLCQERQRCQCQWDHQP